MLYNIHTRVIHKMYIFEQINKHYIHLKHNITTICNGVIVTSGFIHGMFKIGDGYSRYNPQNIIRKPCLLRTLVCAIMVIQIIMSRVHETHYNIISTGNPLCGVSSVLQVHEITAMHGARCCRSVILYRSPRVSCAFRLHTVV